MAKEPSIEYPWQKTPTQLIQYAQDLMDEESDFENQLAFLLIDVGVETMFHYISFFARGCDRCCYTPLGAR